MRGRASYYDDHVRRSYGPRDSRDMSDPRNRYSVDSLASRGSSRYTPSDSVDSLGPRAREAFRDSISSFESHRHTQRYDRYHSDGVRDSRDSRFRDSFDSRYNDRSFDRDYRRDSHESFDSRISESDSHGRVGLRDSRGYDSAQDSRDSQDGRDYRGGSWRAPGYSDISQTESTDSQRYRRSYRYDDYDAYRDNRRRDYADERSVRDSERDLGGTGSSFASEYRYSDGGYSEHSMDRDSEFTDRSRDRTYRDRWRDRTPADSSEYEQELRDRHYIRERGETETDRSSEFSAKASPSSAEKQLSESDQDEDYQDEEFDMESTSNLVADSAPGTNPCADTDADSAEHSPTDARPSPTATDTTAGDMGDEMGPTMSTNHHNHDQEPTGTPAKDPNYLSISDLPTAEDLAHAPRPVDHVEEFNKYYDVSYDENMSHENTVVRFSLEANQVREFSVSRDADNSAELSQSLSPRSFAAVSADRGTKAAKSPRVGAPSAASLRHPREPARHELRLYARGPARDNRRQHRADEPPQNREQVPFEQRKQQQQHHHQQVKWVDIMSGDRGRPSHALAGEKRGKGLSLSTPDYPARALSSCTASAEDRALQNLLSFNGGRSSELSPFRGLHSQSAHPGPHASTVADVDILHFLLEKLLADEKKKTTKYARVAPLPTERLRFAGARREVPVEAVLSDLNHRYQAVAHKSIDTKDLVQEALLLSHSEENPQKRKAIDETLTETVMEMLKDSTIKKLVLDTTLKRLSQQGTAGV